MEWPRSTSGPTEGHRLFEAWLCATYGTSTSTGRPHYAGMRLFVEDLRARKAPLKSALSVYRWMATAHPGVHRKPRALFRAAIEAMSRGQVPAAAWGRS